ncbi:MAG: hypothetical protein JSR77_03500 [Planctomycetes bacterium]|nr:hypothetical protein [Planctomycetota bacterium]
MHTPLTDSEFLDRFDSARLPGPDWTHEAHVRAAWLYLRQHQLDEAHILIRVRIIRLNAFHNLNETPQHGYHDTLTRVMLMLVRHAMAGDPSADSLTFARRHAAAIGKEAVLRHYSRDLVNSAAARARFIEPDLAPLPT